MTATRGATWESCPAWNTSAIFWAPEIVWHEGTYHMYASYVPGVPREWSGARRMLLGREAFHAGIDHAIRRERERPNRWRMWYKDEDNHMKFHCHRSGLV